MSPCSAASGSIASRWASRISRPKCRRPSSACRATSRRRTSSTTPAARASSPRTSISFTASPTRSPRGSGARSSRSSRSAPTGSRSTRSHTCRGSKAPRRKNPPRGSPVPRAQPRPPRARSRQMGMDHFALPEDELSRAIESRTLHRNFMGYTVQSAQDMVALGISGIGDVQDAFAQNVKKLPDYASALAAGRFPIERGYTLDEDDVVRRHVITQLMCNAHLDIHDVERRFGLSFREAFATELAELTGRDSYVADGLVTVSDHAIELTTLGRLFVRNVCMVFDRHLRHRSSQSTPVFSRTV